MSIIQFLITFTLGVLFAEFAVPALQNMRTRARHNKRMRTVQILTEQGWTCTPPRVRSNVRRIHDTQPWDVASDYLGVQAGSEPGHE